MAEEKPRMTINKPSQRLTGIFDQAVLPYPFVQKKLMFGCPAAFVNGNMACGIYEDKFFLRLKEADRREFATVERSQQFAPMGRIMKEYMVFPAWMLDEPDTLDIWLQKCLSFTRSLPVNVKEKGK
jgi:TfoX/Sxy family transcriptional regulator of competence genes